MKLLAPSGAKILLIGEGPTEEDLRAGVPFTGHAGRELNTMLADADLSRANVALTYLFQERPPGGDINAWAVPRTNLNLNPLLPWSGIPCKKGVVDPHDQVLSWRVWGDEGLVFRDAMFPDVPQEYRWGGGSDEC